MTLNLKIEVKIDAFGEILYFTDKTGEYAVDTNEGGWGTPNEIRNQFALMAINEKLTITNSKEFTNPLTSQIVYNELLENDYETQFEFEMGYDGGYKHHFLVIPVSIDAISTLAGAALSEGNYFYIPGDALYQKGADDANVLVEDYSVLVDETNVNKPLQANCQKLWCPDLSTKEAQLYNDYRAARETCKDESKILTEVLELYLNLVNANGAFYQALQIEAENIIIFNRTKYGL
jgi:hypothetical protein